MNRPKAKIFLSRNILIVCFTVFICTLVFPLQANSDSVTITIVQQSITFNKSLQCEIDERIQLFEGELRLDYNVRPVVTISQQTDSIVRYSIRTETNEQDKLDIQNLLEDMLDYFRDRTDIVTTNNEYGLIFTLQTLRLEETKKTAVVTDVENAEAVAQKVAAEQAVSLKSSDSISVDVEIIDTVTNEVSETKTYRIANVDVPREESDTTKPLILNSATSQGSLYTVLLGEFFGEQPLSAFSKLPNFKIYPGIDSKYRYTTGEAKTRNEAVIILKDAQKLGYKLSSITTIREVQSRSYTNVYVVQICAGTERRDKSYFENIEFVDEYYTPTDGMYRYAYGRCTTAQNALKNMQYLKSKGYTNVFITNVKGYNYSRNMGR